MNVPVDDRMIEQSKACEMQRFITVNNAKDGSTNVP
jgi:hypothetical protein